MYNCVIKPGAVEPNDRNPYNTDGDFYEKMDKTADGFFTGLQRGSLFEGTGRFERTASGGGNPFHGRCARSR